MISIDDDHKGFCVEHLSVERNRQHHINLLLLSDANTGTKHYVWIKHFSRLLVKEQNIGNRAMCVIAVSTFLVLTSVGKSHPSLSDTFAATGGLSQRKLRKKQAQIPRYQQTTQTELLPSL